MITFGILITDVLMNVITIDINIIYILNQQFAALWIRFQIPFCKYFDY